MNINKKNITIGVLGTALLATSGLGTVSAASHADEDKPGPHRNPEIREMVENRDFESWSQYADLPDTLAGFDEAAFNQFADMVELKQAGDKDAAEEIRKSLGLPIRGEHRGKKGEQDQHREDMQKIILSGDFEKWVEELEAHGADASVLTQDNFNKIKTAVKSEDREAIKAVHEELGIGPKHKGPHNGDRARKILEVSYEEWAERATKRGLPADTVNEATFNTLQQAATLFQSGDKEAAKTLLDEAGVTPPQATYWKQFAGKKGRVGQGQRGER